MHDKNPHGEPKPALPPQLSGATGPPNGPPEVPPQVPPKSQEVPLDFRKASPEVPSVPPEVPPRCHRRFRIRNLTGATEVPPVMVLSPKRFHQGC